MRYILFLSLIGARIISSFKVGININNIITPIFQKFIRTSAASIITISTLSIGIPNELFVAKADTQTITSTSINDLDAEALSVYRKARQAEIDGELLDAQSLYEQIVVSYPEFSIAWADLGNVLTTRGNLDQALLCYKKAISLNPKRDNLAVILLNKAVLEEALGKNDEALRDLDASERISGPQPSLITNKAVFLSNLGKWKESNDLFEKVISSADRNALPWWLRYSMSLLEIGRGTESLAFLERTLNRFPDETECRAFAAALFTALGTGQEGLNYWNKIPENERTPYLQGILTTTSSDSSNKLFIEDKLHWGPVAIDSFKTFVKTYLK